MPRARRLFGRVECMKKPIRDGRITTANCRTGHAVQIDPRFLKTGIFQMPAGDFASELGDLGIWKQTTNAKNPQLARAYAIHDATVHDCGRSNRKWRNERSSVASSKCPDIRAERLSLCRNASTG